HLCLKEEMVADLRYINSLELEVDSLNSQLETQKTQFLNEIDRLSREYYFADYMNAILGVYIELNEVTNLQCDYLKTLEKCECLEKELSKSKMMSISLETLKKHAINLELDLQQCSRSIDLYSISLQDTSSPNPICLMAKETSSQAWLWHRRLSHQNFDTINLLSKNDIVTGFSKLKFVKDHLCSSCTEFLNKTLHVYFSFEVIYHQMSIARTPEQNGVVERRNRTLVEAARIMLSAAKVPLYFWAEAIATACLLKTVHSDGENIDKMKEKGDARIFEKGDECIFVGYSTQSRAYRVFNKRTRVIMESIHVNFDELPHMASAHNSSDPGPTRQTMASVQNSTDPGPTCQKMASVQISSDPAPECQTMALEHNSLSPGRNCQENVSHGDKTGTTSNELDLLFSPMFDELLNGSSKVVSMSSAISAADAPNHRQQPTTPLNNHTTPEPTCQTPPITTSVISSENINQAEPHAENAQV
nr:hypothetical protein [Tanacetum cinerariifolium]